MKPIVYLSIFFFILNDLQAQTLNKNTSYGAQYAGSVGFLSGGVYKHNAKDNLSIGLVYGFTPKNVGGPLGSLSLKVRYNPFQIKVFRKLSVEPIQIGFFLAQNFGKNIDFKWGQQYAKGYYWWGSSFRQHAFFSTQLSLTFPKGYFSKASLYLEANTNDLYIYSYFSNRHTISLYDIFFLGIGTRFYVRGKSITKKAYHRCHDTLD